MFLNCYYTVEDRLRVLMFSSQYFDYFVTLSEEIEYVWKSPFSFVTALFLVTRYLPLIDTATMMAREHKPSLETDCCSRIAEYYTPSPSQRTCSILWHIEGCKLTRGELHLSY
jgi:hypothetical protein